MHFKRKMKVLTDWLEKLKRKHDRNIDWDEWACMSTDSKFRGAGEVLSSSKHWSPEFPSAWAYHLLSVCQSWKD